MKHLLVVSMLAAAAIPSFGAGASAAGKAETAALEEALIRLELSWGKAMTDKDYQKVDEILADDWAALDPKGKFLSKAQFMADLKAGVTASQAVEYGPIKVTIFEGFAIARGSNKETATFQGKKSTGEYAWTDVLVKRNGRWRILSSQYTKIK